MKQEEFKCKLQELVAEGEDVKTEVDKQMAKLDDILDALYILFETEIWDD